MQNHLLRRLSTLVLVAISFLCAGAPALAQEATYDLDLPAQPLADALRAVGKRTDTNILIDKRLVHDLRAPALSARLTAQEAIARLLAGTGLGIKWVDEKTIMLVADGESRSASPGSKNAPEKTGAVLGGDEAGNEPVGRLRLAQAERGESTNRESAIARTRVQKVEEGSTLDEVLVLGTNIRGATNPTAPLVVLDREYIASTGIATTTRLVESLPQNFALTTPSGVSTPGATSSAEQGSAVNLRGLGEGTTLVLVNGRRVALSFLGSAVDVSVLPLSAIERVEVLTDGASALYGSDAVGGVVNFVLRKEFSGSDTQLRAGWADGVNEYRASQTIGGAWGSGNALVSAEYYSRDGLPAAERDFVPEESIIGSLYPEDRNRSILFSGRQELTSALEIFSDVLFINRNSRNQGGRITTVFNEAVRWDNEQVAAALGFDWELGGDWRIEAAGNYATSDQEAERDVAVTLETANLDHGFEVVAFDLKADGPLFELPGGTVRMAAGLSTRSEKLEAFNTRDGIPFFAYSDEQDVHSAFAELSVPIVGEGNSSALARRLELSLAGRYDDYSSFGSSFDPRAGIFWEPVAGLSLRGSYGTSYVSPKLTDYNPSTTSGGAFFQPDPGVGGTTYQLQVLGTDVLNLRAQEATSFSLGLEVAPPSVEGLRLGINYYDIDFKDQIAEPPPPGIVLADAASYPGIVIRDPSVEQVLEYIAIAESAGTPFFPLNPDFSFNTNFTPDQIDVILDARRRNLSVVDTKGFDFFASYAFNVGAAQMSAGLDGTHILERIRRVTESSPTIETVDTFYNPPDWRLRGYLGWSWNGWSANAFVNYTDSYDDNRRQPMRKIDSYTTVDIRLARSFSSDNGILSGLTLALSAQNLLDEEPPAALVYETLRDMGFDPTNADPLGRLVALEIIKTW